MRLHRIHDMEMLSGDCHSWLCQMLIMNGLIKDLLGLPVVGEALL
jgi:hypothetical protein